MVVGSRKVFEMLGGNPKSESDSGEEEIHGALVLQALTWRRSKRRTETSEFPILATPNSERADQERNTLPSTRSASTAVVSTL